MNDAGDPLTDSVQLEVNQQLEWLEIFTGFEQGNRYSISDSRHGIVLHALERSSRIYRYFLGRNRPFTIWLIKPNRDLYVRLEAPYRFLFRELAVYGVDGSPIGRITRDFSFVHPRFTVYDAQGIAAFEIRRHVAEIWTFRIFRRSQEVGVIRKLLGSGRKEYFSDADSFRLNFGSPARLPHKQLLLAAAFLIDFVFFEDNQSGGAEIGFG